MKRRFGSPRGLGLLAAMVIGVSLFGAGVNPAAGAGCEPGAVRWAGSSNTLYVTGPVTCTLSQLAPLSPAPITQVDPGAKIWLVGANVVLQEGATLQLHGAGAGGDVNELRLRSNPDSVVFLRAYAGNVSIRNTKVTSWDEGAGGPDTDHANKRAYIQVRSFLDPNGVPQQSRMDIADSDIGYLGHFAAESYGLVWKVLGTGVFDKVDVFGDVTNSRIHDNYFGAYTYGAFGMKWINNEFFNNVSYGLDPHDDSDSLLIENNRSHDNGNHGIICSQRCDNLTIRGNVAERNTGHGIMIHRGVTNSVVEGNTAANNTDTGIVAFESFDNRIVNNTVTGNLRGIRLSVGSANNLIEGNTIAGNQAYGIYLYKGSDVPVSGDGRPKFNRFVRNQIRDNGSYAVQAEDSDDNLFDGNVFSGNGGGLRFQNSFRNQVVNSDPPNVPVEGQGAVAPPGEAPAAALDTAPACPPDRVPGAGFTDVDAGNVHRSPIDCLAWYDITSGGPAGLGADRFGPELEVRRGQMASFIARVIDRVDSRLLPDANREFPCESDPSLGLAADHPHAAAIRRLAGAGVVDGGVAGKPSDCYGPELAVRRDQMASFLHRALELTTGDRIRSATDAFDDDAGNPHESTINALTGKGVVAGKGVRSYDPAAPVRRDQMASFLARTLSYLVGEKRTAPPA